MPSRATLGLLATDIGLRYQSTLWHGFADKARERGANVVCFVGEPPIHNEGEHCLGILHKLIQAHHLDGLALPPIILGPLPQTRQDLCAPAGRIPTVTMGTAIKGLPGVIVDNIQGIHELMTHLIEVHGYRRIAFIRGPEHHTEAETRYRAYRAALEAYDLPFDPGLIAQGDFLTSRHAVRTLWDEQLQKPEAIVAANDRMALDALEQLQARGVRVPDDIAIVGFDDIADARFATPPLTTVRQPVYEIGQRAADLLLGILAGKPMPDRVVLPTTLKVRRSCGCSTLTAIGVRQLAASSTEPPLPLEQILPLVAETIHRQLTESTIGIPAPRIKAETTQLLHAFARDIDNPTTLHFASTLENLLESWQRSNQAPLPWVQVLAAMRHTLLPHLPPNLRARAEDLWAQGLILAAHAAARECTARRIQSVRKMHAVRKMGQALMTTLNVNQLMDAVADQLPHLDIKSCYILLYTSPAQTTQQAAELPSPATSTPWVRLALAYRRGKRLIPDAQTAHYPLRYLIPPAFLPDDDQPYHFVVEPLRFHDEHLGILLCEVGPQEGIVYENLRDQISSALKGARLLQALRETYTEVEQRVEERTAALRREIAERERGERIREILYRISEAAHNARSLKDLYPVIHHSVKELMPADNLYIALYDRDAQTIHFPYYVDQYDSPPEPQPFGKGLTEYVIRTGHPQLVNARRLHDLVATGEVEILGTPALDWLGVPLQVHGETIGVLALQTYDGDFRFGEEEKQLLMFVSAQVAEAIQRVRSEAERKDLLETLQRRNTQLRTAVEVSKSTVSSLDPDTLIVQTVELIRERFDFYYVGLFLVEEIEGERYAVLRAGTGEAGRTMLAAGHKLRVGGGSMIGWCTAHGEARIALDVGEEAIRFDNPLLPLTRSEMALPLISHSQGCIGALTVQSTEAAAFSEEDIAILQTIADYLAIALENARLYHQVQEYATSLEERVAKRTAELLAINKELESFSYSVSHDLRAPLRSIDGFSQALLEDYNEQLDEVGRDYLRRVRKASQRMGQLIDDLLKLSRLTRGEMHRGPVNLSAIAREIAAELRMRDPARNVRFNIADGLVTQGDARLLRIALENLLDNAWKFTGKREKAEITFDATEINGQTTYFVRDNGVGFDMTYANKLFGAFQRLHAAHEFEGTGIGLATVQRIIHRHGGRIWAESTVGQGATFYFTL